MKGFGFRQVGYLPAVGYKFGRWTDSIMMQRSLGPGATEPPTSVNGPAPSGMRPMQSRPRIWHAA